MSPESCVDAYNRITARLLRRGQRPASHSARMLGSAQRYVDWCAARTINPKHWMIARHEWSGWTHRIAISKLSDASPRFRASWEEWIAAKYAEWDVEKRDRAAVVADTNKIEATTILGEAQKAAYAHHGEAELCMVAGSSLTGGWHPESRWCAACRLGVECRTRLSPHVRERRDNARGR